MEKYFSIALLTIHPLIIVKFFSTLNSELSIFVRQGNAKGEGGVLNAVVEVVLLPDGDPLHVVHVDLDLHPALALLLVHHLLSDVVQGRVIVPGLIMFFIVHKLNFSKIHTVVIWLQKFLKLNGQLITNQIFMYGLILIVLLLVLDPDGRECVHYC